jgi:hypothetical protein
VLCNLQYQLDAWQEADLTYDRTTLILYLDGTAGCSSTAKLDIVGSNNISLVDGSDGATFPGFVRDLEVYNTVEVPEVSSPVPASLALIDPTMSPADKILDSCPSEAQLEAIDAAVPISFEADPSAPTLVCTKAAGSRDLTNLERITYTILMVMQHL